MTTHSTPTGADAMKEAEALIQEVADAGYNFGWDRALRLPNVTESRAELQDAKAALLAHIRKLVEAQPAAVAGDFDGFYEDAYDACAALIKPHVDAGRLPGSVVEAFTILIERFAAPAAPLVGEPPRRKVTDDELREWSERHDLGSTRLTELRDIFEDAQTLVPASPAAAAGVPTDERKG